MTVDSLKGLTDLAERLFWHPFSSSHFSYRQNVSSKFTRDFRIDNFNSCTLLKRVSKCFLLNLKNSCFFVSLFTTANSKTCVFLRLTWRLGNFRSNRVVELVSLLFRIFLVFLELSLRKFALNELCNIPKNRISETDDKFNSSTIFLWIANRNVPGSSQDPLLIWLQRRFHLAPSGDLFGPSRCFWKTRPNFLCVRHYRKQIKIYPYL